MPTLSYLYVRRLTVVVAILTLLTFVVLVNNDPYLPWKTYLQPEDYFKVQEGMHESEVDIVLRHGEKSEKPYLGWYHYRSGHPPMCIHVKYDSTRRVIDKMVTIHKR